MFLLLTMETYIIFHYFGIVPEKFCSHALKNNWDGMAVKMKKQSKRL